MIEAYARLADWRATAKVVRSEHRHILEAIRQRDADEAKRAVGDHIHSFYNIQNAKGLNQTH